MTNQTPWLEVDIDGLRSTLERKGKSSRYLSSSRTHGMKILRAFR